MTAPLPTERSFGLSVGTVCLTAAAWFWWRGSQPVAALLLTAGALLVGFGLMAPAALRVANRVWWRFAQAVGWVNARIILTVFFVVVLTPAGMLMRLVGRNPLRAAAATTNWMPYSARRRNVKHYERLF